jgi:hypothetical protein
VVVPYGRGIVFLHGGDPGGASRGDERNIASLLPPTGSVVQRVRHRQSTGTDVLETAVMMPNGKWGIIEAKSLPSPSYLQASYDDGGFDLPSHGH